MCRNASEAFPKGLQMGTIIQDPKVFLSARGMNKEKRLDRLLSIRDWVLKTRIASIEYEKTVSEYGQLIYSSDDEAETDLTSDKMFARQIKAVQTNGSQPKGENSESESDSEGNYGPKYSSSRRLRRPKVRKISMKEIDLAPKDFEGCDINILDDLDIRGWGKFKLKLDGFSQGSEHLSVLQVRGIALEQKKRLTVVEIHTQCALTFSKDSRCSPSSFSKSRLLRHVSSSGMFYSNFDTRNSHFKEQY